jgi:hypothetical protein
VAPLGVWQDSTAGERVILLPTAGDTPLLPPWLAPEAPPAKVPDGNGLEAEAVLQPWRVGGLVLDPLQALDLLVALPAGPSDYGRVTWGDDLRFWSLAAKLALEQLAGQRYLPAIEFDQETGAYHAMWLPTLDGPHDRARLRALIEAMPAVCRAVLPLDARPDPADVPTPAVLLERFLRRTVDRAVRDWGYGRLDRRRHEPEGIAAAWWAALWDEEENRIDVPVGERRRLAGFYEAWRAWTDPLRREADAAYRICFRLEPPEVDAETGDVVSPDWTLHYLLQASDDPSLLVPAEQVWTARGSGLELLSRRFEGAQERLLAALWRAGGLFPPIRDSLRATRPSSTSLGVDEVYAFLREVGPLLEASGFGVLVPPWWDKPGARLGVRARVQPAPDRTGRGILNLDSLVAFDWTLALGGEPLSEEEFQRLAALKMPLVRVRGHWVMLQPEEVEAAIAFYERKRQQEQVPLRDALRMALGGTEEVEGLPLQEVEAGGWFDELLERLEGGERMAALPAPDGLAGTLRPYQTRGYAWLAFLRRWGLGACLADDMGLGKTVQAIALLLREREEAGDGGDGVGPALVICPTSVVGNWQREIQRFAPALRVLVHHGGDRAAGEAFVAEALDHDVVVSTYGLARRDVQDLVHVRWSDVILDEAQNIKNPQAKQTQAVRRLPAANRIALTGTPVENRLSDLWSIMHFLNPGFLGPQQRFRRELALPIERYRDEEAMARLKALVGPFILRRVKTDPTVIADLPEKQEMKVYCSLTAEQATLYQAVVDDSLKRVEEAAGDMDRRGAVLRALMQLKQVCNHPAQFLSDGSALPGRSGKLARLGEMLEEALSVGDRALVFTQFSEMGGMLRAHLQRLFGVEVLYLYGGTPQKQRDRMVERFQAADGGPPVFILSLRAGGTGLNLTAANHVFHYDRWWNPAVENQATDRAYRIGQTRDVQVHKFICAGTLEERIDELIESKIALAESVVGAGEGWLTELGTDELREVLALRA